MIKNKTLYIEWIKTLIQPTILYLIIIIGLYFLPNKNFFSILFLILSIVLANKIYSNITNGTKPDWIEYNKLVTSTLFFISITSLLYSFGGWFGIFGLGLVLILFAGWRIYKQFDLFDNLTTYISDNLFKGKRYDFDPLKKKEKQEVIDDESSREDRGESIGDTQQRGSAGVEDETPSVISGTGVVEESLSFLQEQDAVIYREETKMGEEESLRDVQQVVSETNNSLKKKRKKKKKSKKKKVVVDG